MDRKHEDPQFSIWWKTWLAFIVLSGWLVLSSVDAAIGGQLLFWAFLSAASAGAAWLASSVIVAFRP